MNYRLTSEEMAKKFDDLRRLYKNDVRTEEGEKKILSETKTEVLESKIKDLENLKQKNGGKLGVYGERSLQLVKAELAKRSGNGDDISEVEENVNKRLDDVSNSYNRYKATGNPARTEKVRDKLLELEKVRRNKTDSLEDNKVRLEQAKLLSDAGFDSRKEFDEFLKKAMPTD